LYNTKQRRSNNDYFIFLLLACESARAVASPEPRGLKKLDPPDEISSFSF